MMMRTACGGMVAESKALMRWAEDQAGSCGGSAERTPLPDEGG